MNYSLIILMIVLCFIIRTTLSYNHSKLKLVLVVHRHGDRAPLNSYPTDPYSSLDYWPEGFEQLTLQGKERMFKLGKYIRQRYINYLGTSPREVYVRSSGVQRCLESVSLLLAGLYPPTGSWIWNESLGKLWQPFPINTMNHLHDGMLNPGSICPLWTEESFNIANSVKVKKFMQKRVELVKYFSNNTGLDLIDYRAVRDTFNIIEIEKWNNYSLPKWINTTIYESLQELNDMSFHFDYSTKLSQRLRSGLLLKEMTNVLKQSVVELKYKIHIYSTHDTLLAALLNALKIFNMRSPPFGAVLFFELYEIDKKHILQVDYLNITESEKPYSMHLPDCYNKSKECLLDRFLDSIKIFIPNDWEKECNTVSKDQHLLKGSKLNKTSKKREL